MQRARILAVRLGTPRLGVEAARARLDWEVTHVNYLRAEGALFVCLGGLITVCDSPQSTVSTRSGGATPGERS
jgi:hypothetical protein